MLAVLSVTRVDMVDGEVRAGQGEGPDLAQSTAQEKVPLVFVLYDTYNGDDV